MGPRPAADRLSDEDLLRGVAGGDADAFASLFRRRHREVYRFALHMAGAACAADDVTQDVFLAVMRDAGSYDAGRGSVMAWLYGIARNQVRRRFASERSLVRFDECEAESGEADAPGAEADVLDSLVRAERIQALREAVGSLPLHYREVVVLCDLQELDYAEAAVALGCAVGTVKSRLSRGRALLGRKLREVGQADGRRASSERAAPVAARAGQSVAGGGR